MASVEVRRASMDDMPALRRVFRRASWSNEGDRPLLSEHLELLEFADTAVHEGRTRAAVVDGKVVGFASTRDGETELELEDLFVDPDWMRRGVGRALIEDAVVIARQRGASALVVAANQHAYAFYTALGFLDCGQVAVEYGSGTRMRRPTG